MIAHRTGIGRRSRPLRNRLSAGGAGRSTRFLCTSPTLRAVLERAADIRNILDGFEWHREAACRDKPDDATFFPDEPKGVRKQQARIGAGAFLLPLLICKRCPVRRYCLEEAIRPVRFTHAESQVAEGAKVREPVISEAWLEGVWGGTLAYERKFTADMPTAEAVDLLERTFTDRLEVAPQRGSSRQSHLSASPSGSKRIVALLEACHVTATWDQGRPAWPKTWRLSVRPLW